MTPEVYLDRVRALLPVLRERVAHAEQLRRLPDETFADFQELGLFRALQPKRYGGYELDPGVFYQAVVEVGTVCGSSAWILGVIGVHNWHLAIFPPQAQEDVWGEDDGIQLSTSLAPTGSVERVKGGYRLRGRWSFSSGCDFCRWAVLGGIVPPKEVGKAPEAPGPDSGCSEPILYGLAAPNAARHGAGTSIMAPIAPPPQPTSRRRVSLPRYQISSAHFSCFHFSLIRLSFLAVPSLE